MTKCTSRSHWYSLLIDWSVGWFVDNVCLWFVKILFLLSFPVLKAHLLSCAVHCRLWLQSMHRSVHVDDDDDEEEEGEGYQSELQTILDSMTRRMIKSELEDFELV